MKRAILILAAIALIAGVSAFLLFRRTGESGTTTLEHWIGAQLQTIANSYLNPQLSFDDLDYQYPGTVTLKNLKLIAEDARMPGGKLSILSAASATLTLAEIPQVGKPIAIEKISLTQPAVSVLLDPATHSFTGFSHLIRRENLEAQSASSPSSQPSKKLPKLSDWFKIKLIELVDGKVIYDPQIAGTDAMELDRINTTLHIEPDAEGTYKLDCEMAREPVFDFKIAGNLDLDHFSAMDVHATLNASLSEEKLNFLPPQLQKILRQYEAKGTLVIDLSGNAPLFHPLAGDANVKLDVTDANLTLGNYRVPVDSLALAADFKDARLNIRDLTIKALEGEAQLTGMTLLNEMLDTAFEANISNMLMQNLLSAKANGDATQLKGRISAHIEATAPIKVVLAKWNTPAGAQASGLATLPLRKDWGKGSVRITEANLAVLPTIREMNATVRGVTTLIGGGSEPKDVLNVDAILTEDRIEITDSTFISTAMAARGKGFIGLDRTLNLLLNGGPIEKVQSMLGSVGAILGKLTDSLTHYHVTGTVGHPVISVEVGQKAVDTAKNVGEKTVEGVGKGIESIGKGIEGIFGK